MSTTVGVSDGICVAGTLSRSSADNDPAHYMLKVESFSLLSEAGIDRFESETFESGDYKWKLVLYPNGNKTDAGENHISLYLLIVDTDSLPKGWEVNAYFKFYVYDHVRENYLTIQDGKKRRFHSVKLESGVAKLLPLKIFKDASSGYLFQDTCVFGVEGFVTPKFVLKENCLSIMKPPSTNNSFTWTIENFSSIKEESIFSEEFKVGKIKWKLELYPKGNGVGAGTHLSLFLYVAENASTLPLHWRIYAKSKLWLRDQAGSDHHECQFGRWFCKPSDAWGSHFLISLSDLNGESKSYVVNDKLIIEVQIDAVGVIRGFT